MPNRELKRFDPSLPLEEAWKPPYTWYTDEEFLQSEKYSIFERSWIPVGRADQLKKPGDYFTGEILGNHYVILKDTMGELQGFHNVCRHNAAKIAVSCGNCKELTCPYHGWVYDLNGSLKTAPHLGKRTNFNRDQLSLKKVSVKQWGPFIFADFDGPWGGENNPRNLDNDVQPLQFLIDEMRIDKMKFLERRIYTLNCNWKVFIDNSLDGGYHVAYTHEGLAEGLEFEGYQTKIEGRTSYQVCKTNGEDDRLGDKVAYAWIFPNFFINRYGKMMDTNTVIPLTPDSCQVVYDFYTEYDDIDEWKIQKLTQKYIGISEEVQMEDKEVCESAQCGMKSMSFECGIYSSKLEQAVWEFHKLIWKEMGAM